MTQTPESIKEEIRKILLSAGAAAVGFAKAEEIDREEDEKFHQWIKDGKNAGMDYLAKHRPLRKNPENVLSGCKTIISLAFNYLPSRWRNESLPSVACYAYGNDYHEALRELLNPSLESFKENLGGDWRLCIDSAPLPERYWAMKSGIGVKGLNGNIIIPGIGSCVFLVEILTSLSLSPDAPSLASCLRCAKCVEACPTGALSEEGEVDSRKCLSYLSIEHIGEWTSEQKKYISSLPNGILFGCDSCLRVCPMNNPMKPTEIKAFSILHPSINLIDYNPASLCREQFAGFFKGSPMKRMKFEGLCRNISSLPQN